MRIEQDLREAFKKGRAFILSEKPQQERRVSAKFLADLLLHQSRLDGDKRQRLDLTGGEITGELDLSYANVPFPVILQSCTFSSPVKMSGTRLPGLTLRNSAIPQFDGHHLKVMGDLDLSEIHECRYVDLVGANVADDLHLSGAKLHHEHRTALNADTITVQGNLDCNNIEVKGAISLQGARIGGSAQFEGAHLDGDGPSNENKALNADGMTVGYEVLANQMTVIGQVSFEDLHCPASLEFAGADLTRSNPRTIALCLDRAKIGGSIYCDGGFHTKGVLKAIAIELGGSFYLDGASLDEPCENALILDRSTIKGNVVASKNSKPFIAHGTVSLNSANIAGRVDFTSARIHVDKGASLKAVRANIGVEMRLQDGFEATGTIKLLGTQIRAALTLEAEHVSSHGPKEVAVDLARAKVGTLHLIGAPAEGVVDLTGAHVLRLIDNPTNYVDNKEKIVLNGLTYDTIHINGVQLKDRMDWLREGTRWIRESEEGYRRPDSGSVPQPWQQLAATYRRLGANRDARTILLNKERERNRGMPWRGKWFWKLWNYAQDGLMGYGYVPWRAFIWVITMVAAGIVYFGVIQSPHSVEPLGRSFTWFDAVTYPVDLLLPIGLGGKTGWHPVGFGAVVALILAVVGWLLSVTAVVGINRAVRD